MRFVAEKKKSLLGSIPVTLISGCAKKLKNDLFKINYMILINNNIVINNIGANHGMFCFSATRLHWLLRTERDRFLPCSSSVALRWESGSIPSPTKEDKCTAVMILRYWILRLAIVTRYWCKRWEQEEGIRSVSYRAKASVVASSLWALRGISITQNPCPRTAPESHIIALQFSLHSPIGREKQLECSIGQKQTGMSCLARGLRYK